MRVITVWVTSLVLVIGVGVGIDAGTGFGRSSHSPRAIPAPWAIFSTPNAGAGGGRLNAVSCPSATSCTAVGGYIEEGGFDRTLAEHWDGSRWSIEAIPSPPFAYPGLDAVSCSSSSSCVTVGSYNTLKSAGHPPADKALVARWDGQKWMSQEAPSPPGVSLNGVSCPSPSSCMAVGWYETRSGNERTLAEHWNGERWMIVSTADRPGRSSVLEAVSCSSTSSCIAVGESEPTFSGPQITLVERWDGASWAIEPTPNPTEYARDFWLDTVSCPSAGFCTAIGYYDDAGNDVPIALTWNGSRWSVQAIPDPAPGKEARVMAVSCSSPSSCSAVGSYADSAWVFVTLAEGWDGRRWAVVPSANPRRGDRYDTGFDGVSCLEVVGCTAVGGYTVSNQSVTLGERN